MKKYHVCMTQAAIVKNLNGRLLCTGLNLEEGGARHALQSCSAVIMANTKTGAAGLYHYPAGRLDKRRPEAGWAMATLDTMCAAIEPDLIVIRAGRAPYAEFASGYGSQSKADQDFRNAGSRDLQVYLAAQGRESTVVLNGTGMAWVALNDGAIAHADTFEEAPDNVIDLSGQKPGTYEDYVLLKDGAN